MIKERYMTEVGKRDSVKVTWAMEVIPLEGTGYFVFIVSLDLLTWMRNVCDYRHPALSLFVNEDADTFYS